MRKQYVLGMTLIASLAFASCSKDEQVVQEGNGIETVQDDGQVLTLQVSNSGDGLTTRAGRPLLSSQAKQDINTIDLFVVNSSNKVVLKKTIGASEWANALDYGTGNGVAGHGKQLQISFKGSENQKLTGTPKGTTYTIYAVAYKNVANSAETNYDLTGDTKFGLSGAAPTTTNDVSTVTLEENNFSAILKSGTVADEIFAGKVEVKVVVDGTKSYITTGDDTIDGTESPSDKKVPTLVLNRQVAGVTGYFTNIPVKVGEYTPAKLRLVASGKSDKVHFTSMLVGETDDATGTSIQNPKNIVNGSQSTTLVCDAPYWKDGGANASENKGYIVYDIDLSKFFVYSGGFSASDLDGDGFVGYKDAQYWVYRGNSVNLEDRNWAADIKGGVLINGDGSDEDSNKTRALSDFWKNIDANAGKQNLVAGSVFAGEFIIPFLQNSGYNTFELQLLDANGNILKNWNVQVPNGQTVGSENGALAAGIGSGTWSEDESRLIYNIYRNHLYSLGLKTADGDGGTKPDPDPDPDPEDKPEDLSKGQDLLINVNDNWEIIHNMEID